jgi:RNA polymerase sigma-70 factor (ECF subfamily)
MDTSTASVNSALQRARRLVAEKVPGRSQQRVLRDVGDARLREVAADYSAALERGDADALVALLTEDVTWSMPPLGHWYAGIGPVAAFARAVPLSGDCGAWRHLPTRVNGQLAVASYLRAPDAPTGAPHRPWSIDVLTLRGDRIAAITSFLGAEHHARAGLPGSLP